MFNDKAADLFEQESLFNMVQHIDPAPVKRRRVKRQRAPRADVMADPESYSMVYLFMGHGFNAQNTGRPLGHCSLQSVEHDQQVKTEAEILAARKAKRRDKRKRRKANKRSRS